MQKTKICVKAVIKYNDKFLILFKNKINNLGEKIYDIPWWWIKFWESPIEALKRELFEEVWLKLKEQYKISRSWLVTKNNSHLIGITYLINLNKKPNIKLSFEHSNYLWLTKTEIQNNEYLPNWLVNEINTISD